MTKHGQLVWNAGLTKDTDLRVKKISESLQGKTWDKVNSKETVEARKSAHVKNNSSKNFQSKESRIKTGLKLQGRKRPEEVKVKISKSHIGIPLSEKHKQQISLYHWDCSKEKNPMYGKSEELSPSWKGGISYEPYLPTFNDKLKKYIRERDNNKCISCGSAGDSLGRVYVHHIDYNKDNCAVNNLISLCGKCHGKTNYNREHWQKYYVDFVINISAQSTILESS